jgi:hypothetical protein
MLGGNGEKGSRLRVTDVNFRRLSQLKYKLVFHFKLATDMVEDDIREFVCDMDRPAFLEKGSSGIWCGWAPVGQSSQLWTSPQLYILRASDLFLRCK